MRADLSTPKAWWLFRWGGNAIVFALLSLIWAAAGQWAACWVSVGAAFGWVFQTLATLALFRSAFFRGRAHGLVYPNKIGGDPDPHPWDPFPEWKEPTP